ncbi:MAG: hypothetical protein ABIB98_02475 [bacterium]
MRKFLIIIFLIIFTRVAYTVAGVYSRDHFLDKSKPFPSWTYTSPYKWLNVWTVWDSGFYYDIAKNGYKNDLEKIRFDLTVPKGGWVRMHAGSLQLGKDRFDLSGSFLGKNISNQLVFIGSESKDKEVSLYNIYEGVPYCIYIGGIDYTNDIVIPAKQALVNEDACIGQVCEFSYITYYSMDRNKVIFQEFFSKEAFEISHVTLGKERPTWLIGKPAEFLGCKTISREDLKFGSVYDYKKHYSSYPFMPLYPLLVGIISKNFGLDMVLAGIIISNFFFIMSIFMLYKLLLFDYSEKFSYYAVIFYIIFPLGFILSGVFTESLFNFLLFSAFYFVRKRSWVLSAIFLSLLPVTRIVGILAIIPTLYIYIKSKAYKKVLTIFPFVLIPIPFIVHLLHVYNLTGDWFAIFNAQKGFGRTDLFFLDIVHAFDRGVTFFLFELVFVIGAVLLSWIGLTKLRMRERSLDFVKGYQLYAILALSFPILTGTVTSYPRYTLGIFPIFLGLVYLVRKVKRIYIFMSLCFVFSLFLMILWVLSTNYLI